MDSAHVQFSRDLHWSPTYVRKSEDCADAVNVSLRTRHKNGSIGLNPLRLAVFQNESPTPVWRHHHALHSISSPSNNSESQKREAALPRRDFNSQFAAVFRSHRSFQGFHHRAGE